jgi:predicted DNA-binding transcriptional regulator AlpA
MTTMTAPSKPLSISEVCGMLNITPPTLKRWVEAGRFPPPLAIGKRQRWAAHVVERALLGLTENGEKKAMARRRAEE